MKVSVLVPSTGWKSSIRAFVLFRCFEQTHRDMEYVFVNDCYSKTAA